MTEALRILVIEDDYALAQDLVRQVRAMGQKVVGPFPDVHDAIHLLDKVDAAILDVRLGQETSFAVADCLANRRVPFVFFTAYDKSVVPQRFHSVRVYQKPCGAATMLHQLQLQAAWAVDSALFDFEECLPELRRRARWLMPDHASADRLIARALRALAREPDPVPVGRALKNRLIELLHECHREERRHLLN